VTADARHPLLRGLIDYAGLFPPARLGMEDAVVAYRAASDGPHAWMLDRFVCPATRLPELADALDEGERLRLAVIVDDDLPRVLHEIAGSGLVAQTLEVRLDGDPEAFARMLRDALTAADLPEPARPFVEVPPDSGPALDALAAAGMAAKVRCGGATVPSPEALAGFVAGCAARDLSWKATAGLHHPFRKADQHGFLNLLAAAGLAASEPTSSGPASAEPAVPRPTPSGTALAPASELAPVLADDDPTHFALDQGGLRWRGRRVDELARTRFAGFGSCSFDEPVEDLLALGALPAAGPEEEAPARA
jgi:hypothetical protein